MNPDDVDEDWAGLKSHTETCLTLSKASFAGAYHSLGSFSFGDVPCDFRRTYNLALNISDGRDRQRNIDQATVITLADRLVMLDTLPTPDTIENRGFLIMSL